MHLTKSIFLVAGILISCVVDVRSNNLVQNIDPELQKKIDDFIENVYLPTNKITSLALSIVKLNSSVPGDLLYTTGWGLADLEKQIVVTNDTQFCIGSVTKSLTSVVVVKTLYEKFPDLGEAVLDTPISKLIPEYNFTLSDRFRSEQITFRDLLGHRVCLQGEGLPLTAQPFNTSEKITFRQRYAGEVCSFRSSYVYNNQMYVSAATIIAEIANSTYDELTQQLFLDMGLTNSAFSKETDDYSNLPGRAMPYYYKDNAWNPFNRELLKRVAPFNPAGGLFASPNDMAKYMMLHLNKGKVDDKQVVPEMPMTWTSNVAMHLPLLGYGVEGSGPLAISTAYGLGLELASYDNYQYNFHTGYFPPYTSMMALFPYHKIGVFISNNQGTGEPVPIDLYSLPLFIFETIRGSENATERASELMKSYRNRMEEQKKIKEKEVERKFRKIGTSEKKAAELVGVYGSGAGGELAIYERFDGQTTGIYLEYGKWLTGWLEDTDDGRVQIKLDSDIVHDNYAVGESEEDNYVEFVNGTLNVQRRQLIAVVEGKFKLGVNLGTLPTIPWDPTSCGPESQ